MTDIGYNWVGTIIFLIIFIAIIITLILLLIGMFRLVEKGKPEKGTNRWIPVSELKKDEEDDEDKEYLCPSCGQSCSKKEYESGFCLDCDMMDGFM